MLFFKYVPKVSGLLLNKEVSRKKYMLLASMHGTIIQTGATCKNIPCYMRDSARRWFIVNKAKIL